MRQRRYFPTVTIWVTGPVYSFSHGARRIGPATKLEDAIDASERLAGNLHRDAMRRDPQPTVHFRPGVEPACTC